MNNILSTLVFTGFLASAAFGSEQAGPNPANLSPTGDHGVALFTGAFTYSYPIAVPPGRRGIQPNLSLLYNSQAQNGWLGLGWNFSIGSIQRSTKKGIPTYDDSQDTFVLQFQGQTSQLVSVSTGSDGTGSYTEYRAQIESAFMRLRYYAPSLWIATSKDGNQYWLEGVGQNTNNSKFFYWGQTKSFDALGNFMQISYPSLSSATWDGAPGAGGAPTAIISTGAIVGFMPSSIAYTGKCTAGTCQTISQSPLNQITFSYEVRPDTMTFSKMGGNQVISTRLKGIQTASNGTTVRSYQLAYSTSSLGISLLSSIALQGSDGTTLSTATFFYEAVSTYTVTLSTSYQLPVNFNQATLGDVTGDGLPDFVQNYSGVGSGAWINNGSGWLSSATWIPPTVLWYTVNWPSESGLYGDYAGTRFGDINGDGRVDVLQGYDANPIRAASSSTWINSGAGWSQAPSQWLPPILMVDQVNVSLGAVLMDVNGDGLSDVVRNSSYTLIGLFGDFIDFQTTYGNAWLNTGNGWVQSSTWIPPIPMADVVERFTQPPSIVPIWDAHNPDAGTRFADLNGDGLIDLLQANGLSTSAWLNNANGWSRATQFNPPVAFLYSGTGHSFWQNGGSDTKARLVDINGDALPDIVQYLSSTTIHAWLNTGNGWIQRDSFVAALSSITADRLEFADVNGDGIVDSFAVSTNAAQAQIFLGQGRPSSVLTTINNGLGGVTQVSYAFSPPPLDEVLLPPVRTVQAVSTSDGMNGAVITSTYAYADGRFDANRLNREFLGFRQVTAMDAEGNYSVTHFLQNDLTISSVNVYKGMISEEVRYDASGNLMTRSTYTISHSTPYPGVYFPFIARADSHIGDKHSAVAYSYDPYGNLIQELAYGDAGVSGDERTAATAYTASTGSYIVALPTLKQVYSGLGTSGTLLSRTSFYYDSAYTQNPTRGELTKTVSMLLGGEDPVSISSFDAYGNLTDTYDALYNATGGAQGNHVHLTYDTTFYQFPISIQQAVGSSLGMPTETSTSDPGTGQLLSQVDVNGSTTTYNYDVFGRLTSVVGPADQITPSSPTLTYQYNISSSPPHSIVTSARVIHASSIVLTTYEFFDGLGRKIQTKAPAPAGRQTISGSVRFNALGQATTSYMPLSQTASSSFFAVSSTHPHITTEYDALARLTRTTNPDGSVSTRAYQGWTETDTDANGHAKTYEKDAYGRVIKIREHFNASDYITNYRYDLLGNLTGITNALGQGTTIQYDTLSRKSAIDDPQMGAWQYVYDPNGNLVQQTDAKSQVISMTYDALNRRTFKIYPDSTAISYSYDSGPYARGLLSEVVDPTGSLQLGYDIEGNILYKQRGLGSDVYVTSMTYDALGRETSLTYPDGSIVNESYDASALSSVQSSGGQTYAILSYSTVTPTKISQVLYGNGMSAQYAYDPNMFRLTSLKALASGATIQNFAYAYDDVGNITGITDSVGPMTQAFAYDPLDRLNEASGSYGTKAYQHDAIGNLTSNPDNAGGAWNFSDLSAISTLAGTVISTSGRIGNGLRFDGSGLAGLNGSTVAFTPAALTITAWVRPLALGSGYAVSRAGSYQFPKIKSDGGVEARLELNTGAQVVAVTSAPMLNLWRHYALAYDGATIRLYVNGQLWASQAAAGRVAPSTQTIRLGEGLNGYLDELNIYPRALSAEEILRRYELYPDLALSEPVTPDSVPGGMTAGVVNTTYTFAFQAWDLNGRDLKYRIDWGTGSYQETAFSTSGAIVQATHTWTSTGTYSLRLQAVQASTESAWSPYNNILIVGASIQTQLELPFLEGVSANFASLGARALTDTLGERVSGVSSTTQTTGYFGYRGDSIAPSAFMALPLGPRASGGTDAPPTPELAPQDLLTVQYSTSAVDISTIALNLLEHGATTLMDANGNLRVVNGRWVLYDFENRPVRIITQDGTLSQYEYDFEGTRTRQTITPLNSSSQTTVYVGGVYDVTGSNATRYITAGALQVASVSPGSTNYFVADHLGSTNLLVNGSPSIERTTRYLPFGGAYDTSGTADDDHKYTGQRLDDASGLYYYGARYYDPQMGRFITPDTFVQDPFDPQSLNRTAYTRNNPIIYSDPDGHFIFAAVLIGAAIGGGLAGTQGRPFSSEAWRNFNWEAARVGALSGAVAGGTGAWAASALGGTALGGLGLAGSIGIGAGAGGIAGFAGYATSSGLTGSPMTWRGVGLAVGSGVVVGGVLGGLTSPHLMPYLRGSESFTGVPTGTPATSALTVSNPSSKGNSTAKPDSSLCGPGTGNHCSLRSSASLEGRASHQAVGEPINLREQLARDWAISNPEAGYQLPIRLNDPQWHSSQGWMKYQQIYDPEGTPINVHYNYNYATGQIGDPKIVRGHVNLLGVI
jgi:RHS repeat-associated protein